MVDAIWYLDPHLAKMIDRGFHLPDMFKQLTGYNNPETHKHKIPPVSCDTLVEYGAKLERLLEHPWLSKIQWKDMKGAVTKCADMIHNYADYLKKQNEISKKNHSSETEARNLKDSQEINILAQNHLIKPTFVARYRKLNEELRLMSDFKSLWLDDFTPTDTRERRYYIDNLSHGVACACVHFRVSRGNNLGTLNFIWRIPKGLSDEELLVRNNVVIQEIMSTIPRYHTRAMRKKFINQCSMLTNNLKPARLRFLYHHLTGDCSSPEHSSQEAIDNRIKQAFELQDPDILIDLRDHNAGKTGKYDIFFEKTKEYLENVVECAADDRRQDPVSHIAAAISLTDLHQRVSETCPPDTEIPSVQWLYLQFSPKRPSSYSSLQFTGKLDVKFCIQSRQFRKAHPDLHYASALFRYEKEMAIKFRDVCHFICMDDKHHIKVGEPGNPVAAVDRGKRVLVANGRKVEVSDHDFTKFSIVPSVIFELEVPETIEGSFYRGKVHVGIKDIVQEPSTPIRHATELKTILESKSAVQPVLFVYTDGGPDHRLTYLSVQLSYIAIYLALDLDMLVAVRTPPMASWKNPPERIMSILNLALQCVGIMRASMADEFESKIKSANTLKLLRAKAESDKNLAEAMHDSIESVKVLLTQLFQRLKLKDENVSVFPPASTEQQESLWNMLVAFGDPLDVDKKQKPLKDAVADRYCISFYFRMQEVLVN